MRLICSSAVSITANEGLREALSGSEPIAVLVTVGKPSEMSELKRIYDNQQNADASLLTPALRFVFEGSRKMKVGRYVWLF